jgi:hypothetical protein
VIIAGNSHVKLFGKGLLLPEKPGEKVVVHWAGPIGTDTMFADHAASHRLKALFASDGGWHLLAISSRDVYRVAALGHGRELEPVIDRTRQLWRRVLPPLASDGRLAWLVFPAGIPRHGSIQHTGLPPAQNEVLNRYTLDELRAIDVIVNEAAGQLCAELGIPVVNPLPALRGADGALPADLMSADGVHFNQRALQIYLDEIERKLGERVVVSSTARPAWRRMTRVDGLSECLVVNLDLPPFPARVGRKEFVDSLTPVVIERLERRGLELPVDGSTAFAEMLDSLDLLEVHTQASAVLDTEVQVDMDLRDIQSLDALFDHLNGPSEHDFVVSTEHDDADDKPYAESPAFAAECRIATMRPSMFTALTESSETLDLENSLGMVSLWRALALQRQGQVAAAVALLERASRPEMPFPLDARRAAFYLERWR